MARKPMVTRTITSTEVDVLCLDITTGNPFTQHVSLTRTYKDEAHVLKAVKAEIESDTVKAVHVTKYEKVENLYGMTEQKFMENAEKLPPREKKEDK